MTTGAGVEFVRTPEACFEALPDFPYTPKYVEIDGLRQAYVEDGPAAGEPVLLLHGQPSYSYLYRKMIPVLAKAGYRVIAMDHLGTGRSDKPTSVKSYSYLGHVDRLERFIGALKLENVTLLCASAYVCCHDLQRRRRAHVAVSGLGLLSQRPDVAVDRHGRLHLRLIEGSTAKRPRRRDHEKKSS
ncbi:MAG: alpha/beta fold hydrolase [Deltaproteobacteria bacterium]|nr:alpha/beta fold hydrolase [Deltaproteobacteria bacterium]